LKSSTIIAIISFLARALFDHIVNVERIKVGKMQTVDALIGEEALLFVKYLRDERPSWKPRVVSLISG